jgi:hypothetical protein
MRVSIERVPEGVRLELTPTAAGEPGTAGVPVAMVLSWTQCDVLLPMLELARRADRFKFSVEV